MVWKILNIFPREAVPYICYLIFTIYNSRGAPQQKTTIPLSAAGAGL